MAGVKWRLLSEPSQIQSIQQILASNARHCEVSSSSPNFVVTVCHRQANTQRKVEVERTRFLLLASAQMEIFTCVFPRQKTVWILLFAVPSRFQNFRFGFCVFDNCQRREIVWWNKLQRNTTDRNLIKDDTTDISTWQTSPRGKKVPKYCQEVPLILQVCKATCIRTSFESTYKYVFEVFRCKPHCEWGGSPMGVIALWHSVPAHITARNYRAGCEPSK